MNPRVSAIITTFNRAHYLKAAIRSVLDQDYSDFELLILDNSSSDTTQDVVRGFQDTKIRYIRHLPLTISASRNLGVREAKGEFVAFLDDDDVWLADKLSSQVVAFNNSSSDVSLVYGGFEWIDKDDRHIKTHRARLRGMILKDLLFQRDSFTGSASNPMMRRSVFDDVGYFDETVVTGEDYEFYLRLALKFKIEVIPSIIVRIRQHRGVRLGDRIDKALLLEEKIFSDYSNIFESDAFLTSFYLQKIGGKYCRIREMDKGRSYLLKAWLRKKSNWRAVIQYVLSFTSVTIYTYAHNAYRKITLFFMSDDRNKI